MYLAELRAVGKDPAWARVMGGDLWLIVTEDPDRTFATYAPHLIYWFNSYSKWFEGTDTSPWPHLDNAEELRAKGLVNVVTPEAAVKLIKHRIAAGDRARCGADEPRVVRQESDAAFQLESPNSRQFDLANGAANRACLFGTDR
jgi:hypothetical protein